MSFSLQKMRSLVEPVALRQGLSDEQITTLFARAAWTTVVEPGDADGGVIRETLGTDKSLRLLLGEKSPDAWARLTDGALEKKRIHHALDRWRPRLDQEAFARALRQARRWHQRLVTPEDSEWPAGLLDLGPHAPAALWIRGDTAALAGCATSVALVGARASTQYGEQVAAELAEGAAMRGISVVSGGAYGIDAVAHRVALASEGSTIAVLAGGLDRWYPAAHSTLFERIEREGVLISEVPCGVTPSRWRFLQRNRLIAAIASATVVVEASKRSGAINSAGHAASMGRPLGAVPGPVTTGTSAGCHRVIREFGAEPVENVDDLVRLVSGSDDHPVLQSAVGPLETRILDALSLRRARSIEEIAAVSGVRADEVLEGIGMLELSDAVRAKGGGYVRSR